MIHDKDPLVSTYISVPKDFGSLNCAAFVAGAVHGMLDSGAGTGAGAPCTGGRGDGDGGAVPGDGGGGGRARDAGAGPRTGVGREMCRGGGEEEFAACV